MTMPASMIVGLPKNELASGLLKGSSARDAVPTAADRTCQLQLLTSAVPLMTI
jgi:hypothetical protein